MFYFVTFSSLFSKKFQLVNATTRVFEGGTEMQTSLQLNYVLMCFLTFKIFHPLYHLFDQKREHKNYILADFGTDKFVIFVVLKMFFSIKGQSFGKCIQPYVAWPSLDAYH
jgi:hypothetical protein